MELDGPFLWAAFRCHFRCRLDFLVRARWLCCRQYLWLPFTVPMPLPSPALSCWNRVCHGHSLSSLRSWRWLWGWQCMAKVQRNLVCVHSASSSKTWPKHVGVPRRGRTGSGEPCEIWLQPLPVGALCFQSTPHCAGDVTNCFESPRKVRPIGWSRSDHFDLSPLWFEE